MTTKKDRKTNTHTYDAQTEITANTVDCRYAPMFSPFLLLCLCFFIGSDHKKYSDDKHISEQQPHSKLTSFPLMKIKHDSSKSETDVKIVELLVLLS